MTVIMNNKRHIKPWWNIRTYEKRGNVSYCINATLITPTIIFFDKFVKRSPRKFQQIGQHLIISQMKLERKIIEKRLQEKVDWYWNRNSKVHWNNTKFTASSGMNSIADRLKLLLFVKLNKLTISISNISGRFLKCSKH